MAGCLSLPSYFKGGAIQLAGYEFRKKLAVKPNNLAFKSSPRSFRGKISCAFKDDGIRHVFGDYVDVTKLRVNDFYSQVNHIDIESAAQRLQADCFEDHVYCLAAVKIDQDHIVGALDLTLENYWQNMCLMPERIRELLFSEQPLDCYINNVVVSLDTRRVGIASNLLGVANDVATSRGMKKAFLHVNQNNKAALDCYLKQGFKGARLGSMLFMWKDL